jgi:Terminase small subunit.
MKPEYLIFIQGMILHGDKTKAYKQAYPGVNDESARTAANRLLRQPDIWQRIHDITTRAQQKAMEELELEATGMVKQQLLTQQRKREVLAAMVNGEVKCKRYIKLRDKVELVFDDLNPFAILRAIELDSKLAGELKKETPKSKHEEWIAGFEGYKIMIGDTEFDAGVKPPATTQKQAYKAPDIISFDWRKADDEILTTRPHLNWPKHDVEDTIAQMKQDYQLTRLDDETFLKWLIKSPKDKHIQPLDNEMATSLLATIYINEITPPQPASVIASVAKQPHEITADNKNNTTNPADRQDIDHPSFLKPGTRVVVPEQNGTITPKTRSKSPPNKIVLPFVVKR